MRIVEVGRYGDHRFGHFLPEIVLSCLLHLLQDHSRDFLRRIEAAVDVYTRRIVVSLHNFEGDAVNFFLGLLKSLAHKALDRIDCFGRVGDSLTLGRIAHFALSTIYKSNDRGSGALAFAVGNNDGFVPFEYRDARISGPKVNSDNLRHSIYPFLLFSLSLVGSHIV